jgi:hypothetical protein
MVRRLEWLSALKVCLSGCMCPKDAVSGCLQGVPISGTERIILGDERLIQAASVSKKNAKAFSAESASLRRCPLEAPVP